MDSKERRRQSKASKDQMACMIQFMEENPSLCKGKLTATFTKQDRKRKYEEMATLLNQLGQGPAKSAEQWRKCWNDHKNVARSKRAKINLDCTQTGGERGTYTELTPMEERILRLTDTAATTGLSQVVEAFHPNEDIRIPVAAAESVEILPDSVKNIPTKPPLEVVEELVVTPLILPESSPSTPPQGADNANSSQPLRNPFPLRRTPMIRRKNRRIRDQRRALPRGVDNAARTVEVMERQQRTLDEISQRLALVSQRLLDITDHLISIRDLIGRNN